MTAEEFDRDQRQAADRLGVQPPQPLPTTLSPVEQRVDQLENDVKSIKNTQLHQNTMLTFIVEKLSGPVALPSASQSTDGGDVNMSQITGPRSAVDDGDDRSPKVAKHG